MGFSASSFCLKYFAFIISSVCLQSLLQLYTLC
jgi:hypothetical protein